MEEPKPVEEEKPPEKVHRPFQSLSIHFPLISLAVDPRLKTPPKELSDKSLSPLSIKMQDNDIQVSEGAFRASIAENFMQTGLELLEDYPPKPKKEIKVMAI